MSLYQSGRQDNGLSYKDVFAIVRDNIHKFKAEEQAMFEAMALEVLAAAAVAKIKCNLKGDAGVK